MKSPPSSSVLALPGNRRQRFLALARRQWPVWLIAGVALASGLLGIGSLMAARLSEKPRWLRPALPFGLDHLNHALTLIVSFTLIYLSFQLLQRRRVAWGMALAGATMAAASHLIRGHLWHAALAPLLLIVLLLSFRRRFTVRSEPRSIAQGVGLMLFSLLLALIYGTVGFWVLDKKDFGVEFSLVGSLARTIRQFILVGNSDLVAQTRYARWFLTSLSLIGLTSVVFALVSLFRPVAYRLRTLPHERALMKSILEKYGGTSLDYFKLWPEKSYFFAPDHQSGVAYKTVGGVALALGDPVGKPEGLATLAHDFLAFCTDNGWSVAFHQAQAHLLPLYRSLGLQSLKIGEEAVVVLETLADTVQHSKHMRHNRNKFEKEGYCLVRYTPPHPPELLKEVKQVSDEWLKMPGRRERGFSLGYFDRDYLNEFPLAVLRDPSGNALAFANEVRSYREGEATIDLMRHRADAPNGTMDYLFIALMKALKEEGYHTFNLGMAPYAGVGDGPDASTEERVAHELAERATRFFSYKHMRDYKGKFDPEWEDRFLIHQGGLLGLVQTAVSLARATD